jgi:hypothetical protein
MEKEVLHPIYRTNKDVPNKAKIETRFLLGTESKNPLIVVGVNPSKATEYDMDLTVTRIKEYAFRNKFDGYIIINIYPQKETNPLDIHENLNNEIHLQNLHEIEHLIKKWKPKSILAAWGETIQLRTFLKICLRDIFVITKKHKLVWQCTGLTISGHPRHPSRGAYRDIVYFDIDTYSKKFL